MSIDLGLESHLSQVSSIGKVYQNKLATLNLVTVADLLYYFPFRYEDLSERKSISEAEIGEVVTIQATLWQITKIRTATGKTLIKALVNDGSSSIGVIWFNQTYLLTILKPNQLINLSGKIGLFNKAKTLINPKYEIIKDGLSTPIHTERLVPIYSETLGLTSKWLRSKIYQILFKEKVSIQDPLTSQLLKQEDLIDLETAIKQIHFPTEFELATAARKRLAFDELLFLHLRNLNQKQHSNQKAKSVILNLSENKLARFRNGLPFKLTTSQEQTINEIMTDIKTHTPMNRLLQGEVGSGKTVVSTFPILACIETGYQAALLAPTEILAKQHFQTISQFLGREYKIVLHTGSTKNVASDFNVVVGTHALLNKGIKFKQLGLVIIDEQQRFGVVQRSILKNQQVKPHFLTMTATPIPRTLALTIFGNLDISVLDELPSGRKLVKTYLVPKEKRTKAYQFVERKIKAGGQAFIICPLIELSETLTSARSAKVEFEQLQSKIFPKFKLGLLHGKLKPKQKDQVIADFRDRKIEILVATPVVEVGIDVANASLIAIEAAERFGVASLHQLRGRVGRSTKQSYCLLFSESQNPSTLERLKLLEKYHNGLQLSEMDLKRRGPGELYGTTQSGLFNLKLSESTNLDLIIHSKEVAERLFSQGLSSELKAKLLHSFANSLRAD